MPESHIDIGSRLELFVDDYLIDSMDGTSLKMHHPIPREIVLQHDRPWEGSATWAHVVLKKDGKYRMWYRAGSNAYKHKPFYTLAYAESTNGICWERPNLGIYDFNGSTDNNILMDSSVCHNLSVFIDGRPETQHTERYKGIAKGPTKGGRGEGTLRGFTSSNGIEWEIVEPDPLIVAPADNWAMFDSPNIVFWDNVQQQYQLFARGWLPNPPELHSDFSRGGGYRTIRRAVSKDFKNWSRFEEIDMGDTPPEHLYTNAATPYFRAPHIYLMFPKRFTTHRIFFENAKAPGLSEATFMTSRDGLHWNRHFMEAFIRPGPDPDNWNERNMLIGSGVVPTSPTEISLYYVEHWNHDSSRARRGTLRTDGFVSVNAGWGGGGFITKPFTFKGSELMVNYSTSVAGHIKLEIDDGTTSINSGELFGDEIQRTVQWSGDKTLGSMSGKPVRLRVNMKDSDLYSIKFM